MSPRAACRLEALGFARVYDYVPGKEDWLARGLPTEGERANRLRAGGVARADVATVGPDETVRIARERVRRSRYGFALVVAADRILLGRLGRATLDGDPSLAAAHVMEGGPSTIRPSTPVEDLRERLDARGLQTALVTTPEGRLIGVVRRDDLGSADV